MNTNFTSVVTCINNNVLLNGALGTPSSGNLVNTTGYLSNNLAGLGAGVATALGNSTNAASGFPALNGSGYLPVTPIIGVTDGSAAAAGNIGEIYTADTPIASAVSMSTGMTANIVSMGLSNGDWDCHGSVTTKPAGTTTTQIISGGLSTTPVMLPSGIEFRGQFGGALAANTVVSLVVPDQPFSVSGGGTTLYLVGQANFLVSTMGMYGQMYCRRTR